MRVSLPHSCGFRQVVDGGSDQEEDQASEDDTPRHTYRNIRWSLMRFLGMLMMTGWRGSGIGENARRRAALRGPGFGSRPREAGLPVVQPSRVRSYPAGGPSWCG